MTIKGETGGPGAATAGSAGVCMMERGGGDLTTGWCELVEEGGPLGTGYHGLPLLILHQMVPRTELDH